MKLWLLRPRGFRDTQVKAQDYPLKPIETKEANNPWDGQYDCTYGFVVRAETEQEARLLAQDETYGDETSVEIEPNHHGKSPTQPWCDPLYSTCVELTADGKQGIVIEDFRAG